MDDVARELGVSKKTLYRFVSNKADLIQKTFELDIFRLKTWAERIASSEMNAIDELLDISRYINEDFDKFNPSTAFDLQKYYPVLFKNHMEEKQRFVYQNIKENIERGIQQGLYRDDLDVDLVAGLYINKMTALHHNDLNFLENLTFEKIFEVMIENHIRGIANQDGVSYFESQKQKIKHGNN
jgi:AcrR family transcriptional regulator